MREFFNKAGKFFKPNPDAIGEDGYTRLQRAIHDNDLKRVKELLKKGASVNFCGSQPHPPLHLALAQGRQRIVLALVDGGADINLPDGFGRRPLHLTVEQTQEAMTLVLLKLGADPNAKTLAGQTALHLVSPDHPAMAAALVKHGARVNEQDDLGNTPLHNSLDHPAMADRLMDLGADPNVRNHKNISPYMMMLDESRLKASPKTLQKMIALKGDLGAANLLGETVLHLAVRLQMEETFLSAISGAELAAKDANGNNVLHALVRTQNIQMIAQVLKRAPELVHDINKKGRTPMKELLNRIDAPPFSFADKCFVTAGMLLANGADIDSADEKGRRLLHHAVLHDRQEFLEDLLRRGANPDLIDVGGKTALHYAIASRSLLAMDILLDNRADPDMPDARGWTILDRLAEQGDRDSSVVQRLIVAGGQYQKQLPLHPEMMRRPRLIDKGGAAARKPSGGHAGGPPPGM